MEVLLSKAIVVTGASKGIGRAAAEALAKQGWSVIGLARSTPIDFPGEFIACDLFDADKTAELANDLAARPGIVGIVNNVGSVRQETFGAVRYEDFAELADMNIRPALQLTQALIPNMQAARFGRIVNITSLVTLGLRFRTSYAAAKAALESLTRSIAIEQASFGITSNAVAPGPCETELFRSNNPPGSASESRYLAGIPVGRFGHPHELGAVIAFLCSDDASFITGQTLFVDGGGSLAGAGRDRPKLQSGPLV